MSVPDLDAYRAALAQVTALASKRADPDALRAEPHVLTTTAKIAHAREALASTLPERGLGTAGTSDILLNTVAPALTQAQCGPRYYSFVIGGSLPEAQLADNLVTTFDNQSQVNLADDSIAFWIEHLATVYVLQLLNLPVDTFLARTITTGATASNVLGLATAREYVVKQFEDPDGIKDWSVAEYGFGRIEVEVYCAGAHASIAKAAALTGIGRANVKEYVRPGDPAGVAFDLNRLEQQLEVNSRTYRGSIVCAAVGEVNTGAITEDLPALRKLCDKYGAWLHVDGAFGAFALLHPDFTRLLPDLALADSITLDGHKWLNVPYDLGLFYARSKTALTDVLGPGLRGGPAYLAPAALESAADQSDPLYAQAAGLPSPLFCRIENSCRLRALPLFAALTSLGKEGYREIFCRNIAYARALDGKLRASSAWTCLVEDPARISNILLFKPSNPSIDAHNVANAVNKAGKIYLGRTVWRGHRAMRMAVSNWATTVEDDLEVAWRALQDGLQSCTHET